MVQPIKTSKGFFPAAWIFSSSPGLSIISVYISVSTDILLMSTDLDYLRRTYPEMFPPPTIEDIIMGVFIFSMLFVIPYLYIRFIEGRLISFVNDRLLPSIRSDYNYKLIDSINRVLKFQIFRSR